MRTLFLTPWNFVNTILVGFLVLGNIQWTLGMVACGPPPVVEHAEHDGSKKQMKFLPGTQLIYACQLGYFREGSQRTICIGPSEQWDGPYMTCRAIHCDELGPPLHGTRIGSRTSFGSEIKFVCNNGYKVVGSAVRTCQADRTWSGHTTECKASSPPSGCSIPPIIDHGNVEMVTQNMVGGKVRYVCQDGYFLVGPNTRTCLKDGTWDKTEPTCQMVACGPPPVVEHAEHDGSKEQMKFLPGTQLTYACQLGYFREGSQRAICMGPGEQWDGPYMTCRARGCGAPGDILNGWRDRGYRFTYPTRLTYYCNEGYELRGGHFRECMANGEWSGELPKCEPSGCSIPPNIDHGNVQMVTQNMVGGKVRYVCQDGYFLVGPNTRTCLKDGTWNTTEPSCQKASCNSWPPQIANGHRVFFSLMHGANALYFCSPGYTLEDNDQSLKCEFGKWAGTRPMCKEKYCPHPGNLKHGRILKIGVKGMFPLESYITSIRHGERLLYECDRDHRLSGPRGAACVYGKWSPQEHPRCMPQSWHIFCLLFFNTFC